MRGFRHSLRIVFLTTRGLSSVATNSLAAIGTISAFIGIYAYLKSPTASIPHERFWIGAVALLTFLFGVYRTFPRSKIVQYFQQPEMTVTVMTADLFLQQSQIVIGFADTFDTDTTDNKIISGFSLQGQLLERLFHGDRELLDSLLQVQLEKLDGEAIDSNLKEHGKMMRYPTGTSVVINHDGRNIYCLAYSKMDNDLRVQSTLDLLWSSMSSLWNCVCANGQLEPIVLPVFGPELARVRNLSREALAKVILMSFVAESRIRPLTRDFTLVVRKQDLANINMLELAAFMRNL